MDRETFPEKLPTDHACCLSELNFNRISMNACGFSHSRNPQAQRGMGDKQRQTHNTDTSLIPMSLR